MKTNYEIAKYIEAWYNSHGFDINIYIDPMTEAVSVVDFVSTKTYNYSLINFVTGFMQSSPIEEMTKVINMIEQQ